MNVMKGKIGTKKTVLMAASLLLMLLSNLVDGEMMDADIREIVKEELGKGE